MRILFDAYELAPGQGKSQGIYNYTKNLLQALIQQLPTDAELVVACNPANLADLQPMGSAAPARVHYAVYGQGAPSKWRRQFWTWGGAARALKTHRCDLYFSPKGFVPHFIRRHVPHARSVVVIHDLIPLWYLEHAPNYFGRLDKWVVPRMLVRSARESDHIVAISASTADDIRQRTGRTEGITVVHNGIPYVAPGPRPRPDPYLFAVTSNFPHKNAARLVQAYRLYTQRCTERGTTALPLVLCGDRHDGVPGLTCVKGISDTELHAYYAHAERFFFVSLIEGFGFPPLEAMRHGTPVVCSDIPSLHEVTEGLALAYVDPLDPAAMAAAMDITAPLPTRAGPAGTHTPATPMPTDMKQRIENRFSWPRCAQGIWACLHQVHAQARLKPHPSGHSPRSA